MTAILIRCINVPKMDSKLRNGNGGY
uniref:Uncharacterized protein n=1 Tax=Vitis vinifera TaxID=29760 RepID=F6H6Z5_VITVI